LYQALYRKYRPKTFDDVCGQEQTVAVLKNQIKSGKVSHAYLFCGSRGTGKTTCAKILAKAVNCEDLNDGDPCDNCSACELINRSSTLDVVEIDAAGNNGVDSIRQLCDEVKYMPSDLKKRVYIIDEVHMLTVAAFNALLKTLEEPPEHILFILATTEIQKIPATIVSRCQRLNFNRIKPDVIVNRIMQIASAEGIQIEREAAYVIARLSDGALRDALSLLESCIGRSNVITAEEISDMLGLGSKDLLFDICEACADSNTARCISLLDTLYERQSDLKSSLSSLFDIYRGVLIAKTVPSPRSFIECSDDHWKRYESISSKISTGVISYHLDILQKLISQYDHISSGKRAFVEVAFIKLCEPSLMCDDPALNARLEKLEAFAKSGNFTSSIVESTASAKKTHSTAKTVKDIPISDEYSESDIPTDPEDDLRNDLPFDIPDVIDNNISNETVIEPENDPINDTPRPAKADKQSFSSRAALLAKMEEDFFLQMYLNESEMYLSGDTLVIKTEKFTCDMLKSMNADETLLKAMSTIDPSVKSVKLEPKAEDGQGDILDTI